jgi:hypothetical protein
MIKTRTPRRAKTVQAFAQAHWWRLLAGLMGFFLSPFLGWIAVGLRPRRRYRRAGETVSGIQIAAALSLVLICPIVAILAIAVRFPIAILVAPFIVAVAFAAVSDRQKRLHIDPDD